MKTQKRYKEVRAKQTYVTTSLMSNYVKDKTRWNNVQFFPSTNFVCKSGAFRLGMKMSWIMKNNAPAHLLLDYLTETQEGEVIPMHQPDPARGAIPRVTQETRAPLPKTCQHTTLSPTDRQRSDPCCKPKSSRCLFSLASRLPPGADTFQ